MIILTGADFVPTESNETLFETGDTAQLFGEELSALLKEADVRIFNLEVPLCDTPAPIAKHGPSLHAPQKAAEGYKAAGVDLAALGNNHILDQGAQGLTKTMEVLTEQGIAFVGAGKDLSEAAKPYILECSGKKIGVYACTEHEFSVAGAHSPGANPFDPLESPDHVAELKKQCDYLIVLYHGGKEHYRYPSPMLRKRCRKLAEKGADLVLCQHSHCIGCKEEYNNSTIVYGQGNFLFDRSESEFWQTGLLVLTDGCSEVRYIPVVRDHQKVRLAGKEKAKEILDGFYARSEEIKEKGFIERKYSELAAESFDRYVNAFSGKDGVAFRAFNKLSGGNLREKRKKSAYGKKQLIALKNYIECETHQELLLTGLEIEIENEQENH